MNFAASKLTPARRAFTLIELLMVIAIIGILAGMLLAGGNAYGKKSRINRTQAELAQLETAIENYKRFKGVFPPDGKFNAAVSPLYYELMGTFPTNSGYQVLKGDDFISTSLILKAFGRGAFVNASTDASEVNSFLPFLKGVETKSNGGVELLAVAVEGPAKAGISGVVDLTDINPWCYVSSNPTNNRTATGVSYDLWADIKVRNTFGGYTIYRIANWQRGPITILKQ